MWPFLKKKRLQDYHTFVDHVRFFILSKRKSNLLSHTTPGRRLANPLLHQHSPSSTAPSSGRHSVFALSRHSLPPDVTLHHRTGGMYGSTYGAKVGPGTD